MAEVWQYADLERLLDRWCDEYQPEWDHTMHLISWLLAVREDPFRTGTSPIPNPHMDTRIAPVPGYDETCPFYALNEELHVIVALLLETTSDDR